MLVSVSYISEPCITLDDETLSTLWLDCIERNEAAGITGGLFFSGEFFFQTIEGEPDRVDALMAKIAADTRHRDVQIVAENDLTARLYDGHPMKLIDASRSPELRARYSRARVADGTLQERTRAIWRLARL